jgi:short-subunit dehydrogenase
MDKVVLLTGAAAGIGAASALRLARRGFSLCLFDMDGDRLAQTADRIRQEVGDSRGPLVFAGDVTKDEDRRAVFEQVLARWSRVDVLVNCAGLGAPGVIEDATLPDVRDLFEVNVFAPIAWIALVGPGMRERGDGRIINLGSICDRVSLPGLGFYGASKFALRAINDAVRGEYRPWGVKVILIEPGPVVTDIWQKGLDLANERFPDLSKSPFQDVYEALVARAERLAAGRGPKADVVARAVCRAATARWPRARYIVPASAQAVRLLGVIPPAIADPLIHFLRTTVGL